MANTARLHQGQTRAIGWYAVQRVRIADWFKPRQGKKQPGQDHLEAIVTPQQTNATSQDDADNIPNTSESQISIESKKEKKQTKEGESQDKVMQKPSTTSKDAKKLKAVVRESHTILVKAHSVFPFQLFPDGINIDRHKLTIIRRQFFGIEQKVSVPLENVKNIEADLGPFFGSVIITSDLFINNIQKVEFLWRDDAKKVQKLVQGAVVAQAEGIDLNKIETKQLRTLLIDLGSGHTKSM
jgi:hypothetical protein